MRGNALQALVKTQRALGYMGQGSFYDFVCMAWPEVEAVDYIDGWHVKLICDELERVYRREIRKIVINIPPGCMKSLIVQVFFPVWAWIQDPTEKFMSASFDANLTKRDARRSLDLIQSKWFQDRWGDRVKIAKDPPITDYKNQHGGWRFSTSVGGKATGNHPTIRIVDDANKPRDVTAVTLEATLRWHKTTWSTRQADPKRVCEVIIMQRLHEGDLAGECIKNGYHLVKLPMEYDPESDGNHPKDPRTEKGDLLWPERFGPAEVTELRNTLGPDAAAQLDQDPTPAGGAIFMKEWFKEWTESTLPAWFDQKIQSWDMAFKGERKNDEVCGFTLARKGPNFYLLPSCKWGNYDFSGTCLAVKELTREVPDALLKLVEGKANGPAVVNALKQEIPGFEEVNPEGGKEARANATTGLFRGGNVFFPPKALAPWRQKLEDQLVRFPRAKRDDGVDALTQGLTFLYNVHMQFVAAMRSVQERVKAGGTVI